MNSYLSGRVYRILPISGIVIGAMFSFGTLAVAAIISGNSTVGSSANITITQLQLAKPATAAVGDVLVAAIAQKGGASSTVTPPEGWTLIQRTDNSTNVGVVTYWKQVSVSEPASYAWTITPATDAQGGITAYSGVEVSSPIDVAAGATGKSNTATAPSVTTASANAEIIAVFAVPNAGITFATPAGMTEKYDASKSGTGPSIASSDAAQAIAGVSGTKSAGITNGSRHWAAQQIALRAVPTSPIPQPVAYWKLDGNSNDSVGVSNGADTNVTYALVDGKINEGAGLDGSSSKIDFDPMVSGIVNLSVAAWVKNPGTADPVNEQHIVAQRSLDTNPGQWQLYLQQHKLNFYSSGLAGDPIMSNASIDDGNWHLVGISQDGSTYTIYIDGVVDKVVTQGAPTDYQLSAIGGAVGYDRRIGSSFFVGAVDGIGIWNTSLSAADFATLYNAGVGKQYPF